MVRFITIIKKKIKANIRFGIDGIIKIFPIYYTSIDRLPLYNYFKIRNNELKYLYRYSKLNYIPGFFIIQYMELIYQFETLDLTILRKKRDEMLLRSMAARTGNGNFLFQAETIRKELEKKENEHNPDEMTLNKFIDYIELSFESIGEIDPYKISTARAFSLFYRAINRNKQLEEKYKNVNSPK